jgi:FtsH-binding integral membrane protein
MKTLARILPLVLVAVTSVLGLIQIPDEFRNDQGSLLQMTVAVGGALHSVLGVVLVTAVLRRKRWAVTAAIAWALSVVYTASVASVAFESQRDAGVIIGGVAAGISCALIGWWVVWAARTWVRPHIPATSDSSSSPR